MSNALTREQFQKVLPPDIRGRVSDEVIAGINKLLDEPELKENFRETLLSFASVMNDGKFKLQSYIDACRYVSYKLLGSGTLESYVKTFPDRYQRLLNEGADNQTISAYAGAFNKTILVNKIFEQTLIPTHVLNADIYQKAINVQAQLMMSSKSDKVRTDAANSLLNHLKKPDNAKFQLDISYKNDSILDDLRNTTQALVEQQKRMLEERVVSTQTIAESEIISKDIEDIEP